MGIKPFKSTSVKLLPLILSSVTLAPAKLFKDLILINNLFYVAVNAVISNTILIQKVNTIKYINEIPANLVIVLNLLLLYITLSER